MNPSASKRRNGAASRWVRPTAQSSSSRSSTCATVSCAPGACVASSSATSSKFICGLSYGEMTCPVAVPSTLATYAWATVAAGNPPWSGMPSACRVSVTQGGLTTLMRIPRGASSAAARAKPSSPAFTRLIAALPRDGCWARTPLVIVIEPPSTIEPSPYLTRRSEEHTSELQSQSNLVCRLLLEKKKTTKNKTYIQIL